ncbi:Retrovirus-related Pol polyprotein from transposon TNT 1-94 [Abeliophyllum distichum]|uniref:Retrovirus-related Pol polyprotein from transposon TNT 1-94 n=1 Tax=Abeliophyllum distichum TaxID=126358 RepID=A0ABD1PTQ0_9LAMI
MNLVRSILSKKYIPREFWPEAVNWCVHILNRSPTLQSKISHLKKHGVVLKSWSGVKPSVEYFRVFGCIGYIHIPDVKRTKLDSKSSKCILLGTEGITNVLLEWRDDENDVTEEEFEENKDEVEEQEQEQEQNEATGVISPSSSSPSSTSSAKNNELNQLATRN